MKRQRRVMMMSTMAETCPPIASSAVKGKTTCPLKCNFPANRLPRQNLSQAVQNHQPRRKPPATNPRTKLNRAQRRETEKPGKTTEEEQGPAIEDAEPKTTEDEKDNEEHSLTKSTEDGEGSSSKVDDVQETSTPQGEASSVSQETSDTTTKEAQDPPLVPESSGDDVAGNAQSPESKPEDVAAVGEAESSPRGEDEQDGDGDQNGETEASNVEPGTEESKDKEPSTTEPGDVEPSNDEHASDAPAADTETPSPAKEAGDVEDEEKAVGEDDAAPATVPGDSQDSGRCENLAIFQVVPALPVFSVCCSLHGGSDAVRYLSSHRSGCQNAEVN